MECEKNATTNGLGPKVVETIAKALVQAADGARAAKWSVPANETIVEREIREQRERESALSSQRAAAAKAQAQILHGHNDSRKEKSGKNSLAESKEVSKSMVHLPTRDTHITLDLHKIPAQEEPKFVAAINNTHKDSGIVTTLESLSRTFRNEKNNSVENVSNDFSFQCNSKDLWLSGSSQNIETSHNEIQDVDSSISAQTPDTDSNSSQEYYATRVLVKPLSEPEEETSSFIRWQKETPIEREIRLAREREEELRREKGLPPLAANNVVSSVKKSEVQKFTNRRNTALNDCRSVQHRIATSRIQQEINEATEREKELHAAGLIQTISEDTVDSKVTRFTDLAGFAIEETERKLRRAVSTSSVAGEPENQSVVASIPQNGQKTSTFWPLFENTPNHSNSNTLNSSKKIPPRVGHKGVMQRFLASHGKVSPVSPTYNRPNPFTSVSYSPAVSPVISSKDIIQKIDATENQVLDDSPRKNSRRGYLSAEERIQTELQEMQKREEELRLQRAKIFAQSQPNLLSIGDLEESDLNHESEETKRSSISGNSDSNSHLENSKETNGDSSYPEVV